MTIVLKTIRFLALTGCLIAVRVFENTLFYDPLLDYFHGDYQIQPIPDLDQVYYFLSLLLRYFLNTTISLLMIYTVLTKMRYVKFAFYMYLALFVVCAILFFILININDPHKLTLFYVRRLLIQPVLLFVLLPALYYQNQTERKKL